MELLISLLEGQRQRHNPIDFIQWCIDEDVPLEEVYKPKGNPLPNIAGRPQNDIRPLWMTESPLMYITFEEMASAILPRVINEMRYLTKKLKAAEIY